MNRSDVSLTRARQLILDALPDPVPETVSLSHALGRYPLQSLVARLPAPSFSQSTRDGFVCRFQDISSTQKTRLPVTAEIPAGTPAAARLAPHTAMRIMTGGAVPQGGTCVVPFEHCREEGDTVVLPPQRVSRRQFIRCRGSDIRVGRRIVPSGVPLSLDHLPHLAETGHESVVVGSRPRVAFCCTGSELVESGENLKSGRKVSSNRYLLEGMIQQAGGLPTNIGPVVDSCPRAREVLEQAVADRFDCIVTTGGMGPGRYDCIKTVFQEMGGKLLYAGIKVRPGRATMFGLLDGVPFFGLPGPPPVVRLLCAELVMPAVRALQGSERPFPVKRRYLLAEDVSCRHGILNLKGAVMEHAATGIVARPARPLEPLQAILLLPGHRRILKQGERVTVHALSAGI